jgi:hypothetical protein
MAERDLLQVTFDYDTIEWLFTTPILSPFSERFHDDSTTAGVEFIVNELWADPSLKRVETTVLLPVDQITPDLEERTRQAITRYCLAQYRVLTQEERSMRRRALPSLVFGIVAVLLYLSVGRLLSNSGSFALEALGEGLYVLGWVAIWFPLDALVFGVRYQHMDADLYKRAMTMRLTIQPRH